jgi:type I pantothenate kinase
MGAAAGDLVDLIVTEARDRNAKVIGITGCVAVGKSTVAAPVSTALAMPVISTDGFIFPAEVLTARDLMGRKGFPESYDVDALIGFVDDIRNKGRASAPIYSHLYYDVIGSDDFATRAIIVDGLHLGHPAMQLRERIDLLINLDAHDDSLKVWYLERFNQLRALAADDPRAYLHPYKDVDVDAMNDMALGVWAAVNQVVIDEEIRPWAHVADLQIHFGPDHSVAEITRR